MVHEPPQVNRAPKSVLCKYYQPSEGVKNAIADGSVRKSHTACLCFSVA
ncbi:MAG: hypothetical protein LDL41_04470 [Coleofasciculus sp. S288]|nr:hypothetical protein [Coleofasciculus sp. S288]